MVWFAIGLDQPEKIQAIGERMKQHPIQLDQEAGRMAKALAEKWGLPTQRYTSRVILRCLERVYAQEFRIDSEQAFAGDFEKAANSSVLNG